jgi:uncharacterized surface protein with fasciclin (FAS1) repeats
VRHGKQRQLCLTDEVAPTACRTIRKFSIRKFPKIPIEQKLTHVLDCTISIAAETICSIVNLSALCAAVTQAGLAGTLSEGSYTIFAPTNDAFSQLGSEMLDAVLADKALLTNILLYHVVDEVLLSTYLECNGSVRMANANETTTVCANDCLYQKR